MTINEKTFSDTSTTTALNSFAKVQDPILEYKSTYKHVLIHFKEDVYIGSMKNMWLFPGIPRTIDMGLKVWFPNNSIGLITKSHFLDKRIQLDTQVIKDGDSVYLTMRNTGLLPVRIREDKILADLTAIPKFKCYVVNIEGQS